MVDGAAIKHFEPLKRNEAPQGLALKHQFEWNQAFFFAAGFFAADLVAVRAAVVAGLAAVLTTSVCGRELP